MSGVFPLGHGITFPQDICYTVQRLHVFMPACVHRLQQMRWLFVFVVPSTFGSVLHFAFVCVFLLTDWRVLIVSPSTLRCCVIACDYRCNEKTVIAEVCTAALRDQL